MNDIWVSGGSFVTHLFAGRVNYSFSTRAFLNALVQYNSDAGQWSSNIRFNVIHRPLSDFFFVYNERRDDRTGNLVDRALVAKLTYRFDNLEHALGVALRARPLELPLHEILAPNAAAPRLPELRLERTERDPAVRAGVRPGCPRGPSI